MTRVVYLLIRLLQSGDMRPADIGLLPVVAHPARLPAMMVGKKNFNKNTRVLHR
jgi:hypothetical protein